MGCEPIEKADKEIVRLRDRLGDARTGLAALSERIETLEAENERLIEEIQKLYKQADGYADLLGSANHDVEQLTKYADDLEAEVKRLKKDLQRYGSHDSPCIALMEIGEECICGFKQALRGEERDK